MKRLAKIKPGKTLGDRIGPVRIVEMKATALNLPDRFFSIERIETGDRIAGRWSLDDAIGFCHEDLIPIEAIERLAGVE